jgi:hypothetical protein
MPAFPESEIGDRELEDLMNYIVALRHHGPEAQTTQR